MFSILKKYSYVLVVFMLFVIFFILCSYLFAVMAGYDLIEHDDLDMFVPWLGNLKYFIFNNYHGRTLINVLTNSIIVLLPDAFGIHSITWINSFAAAIKGFFLAILCCQISNLLFAFDNKSKTLPKYLLLLLTASILCCLYIDVFKTYFEIMLHTAFYGFTFPFIFFVFFWKKFILNYLSDFNNSSFYILCILAFINGGSTEFCSFISVVALFAILMYSIFVDKKCIKNLLILFIINFCATCLYISNTHFIGGWLEKIDNMNRNFGSRFEYLSQFLSDTIAVFLNEYILFLIIILSLLIYIYKIDKNNLKLLLPIVSIFIGLFLFLISLFFAGTLDMHSTYIYHLDIVVQVKILFIIIIFYSNIIFGKI